MLLLAVGGITNPEILNRPAIHDPAEMEFSLFVIYGSILAMEAEIRIPGADKSIKSLRFIAQGRIRMWRSKDIDHCFS